MPALQEEVVKDQVDKEQNDKEEDIKEQEEQKENENSVETAGKSSDVEIISSEGNTGRDSLTFLVVADNKLKETIILWNIVLFLNCCINQVINLEKTSVDPMRKERAQMLPLLLVRK
jgi:hypothetical protein